MPLRVGGDGSVEGGEYFLYDSKPSGDDDSEEENDKEPPDSDNDCVVGHDPPDVAEFLHRVVCLLIRVCGVIDTTCFCGAAWLTCIQVEPALVASSRLRMESGLKERRLVCDPHSANPILGFRGFFSG